MILNELIQSNLLLRCQFPEFQSDLPHFDCAKTKFALDFKIGNFFERMRSNLTINPGFGSAIPLDKTCHPY